MIIISSKTKKVFMLCSFVESIRHLRIYLFFLLLLAVYERIIPTSTVLIQICTCVFLVYSIFIILFYIPKNGSVQNIKRTITVSNSKDRSKNTSKLCGPSLLFFILMTTINETLLISRLTTVSS